MVARPCNPWRFMMSPTPGADTKLHMIYFGPKFAKNIYFELGKDQRMWLGWRLLAHLTVIGPFRMVEQGRSQTQGEMRAVVSRRRRRTGIP